MKSPSHLSEKARKIVLKTLESRGSVRVDSKTLRDALKKSGEYIKSAHYSGAGGGKVCRARSVCMDEVLNFLHKEFLKRRRSYARNLGNKFCIVALGGYARSDTAPYSDIDLMFLYDSSVGEELKTLVVDEILYPLWDIGLKVGHSSRTREEALKFAQEDFIARTSMIDSRFICGSRKLFDKYEASLSRFLKRNASPHIDELFRLKRDRHQRHGWTPFLQEPNVKNGVGGLRDFQTLMWIARLKIGADSLVYLATKRVITTSEYAQMARAHAFLMRVRNSMHYKFSRNVDLLNSDIQASVALDLGFSKEDEDSNIEDFMRKLYLAFKAIDNIAKAARKRMGIVLPEDVFLTTAKASMNTLRENTTLDGFVIKNGEIFASTPDVFSKDPAKLIKVFRHCQVHGAAPSDSLDILIKDSLKLIDANMRLSKDASDTFLEILQDKGRVAPILKLMHFSGVLDGFIPEFGDINCLVQHEFYHRYTADFHTINTIAQLDRIFCSSDDDSTFGCYHTALLSTRAPWLAYLILFLHDIGKRDGIKGHAETGAEIAKKVLKRLGLPDSDAQTVIYCVLNHLLMAKFAHENDVEDEAAAETFANMVADEDLLRYLYVITFCDSKGTSETFWNSYKQSLHRILYEGAIEKIGKDEGRIASLYKERKEQVVREVLEVPGFSKMENFVREHIENLPRNYFIFHGRDNLAMHIKMIAALKKQILRARIKDGSTDSLLPIVEWSDDPNSSMGALSVVSFDKNGLFMVLSGVLASLGLNVLSSKILTRTDGITIDTFYVSGSKFGDGIVSPRLKAKFLNELKVSMGDKNYLKNLLKKSAAPKISDELVKHKKMSKISLRLEGKKLVLVVRTPDEKGLLFKMAKTIFKHAYSITFARITTESGWAMDAFHLEPIAGASDPKILKKALRETLHR